MSATTRKILIHCHIFKNAGTTFDWSLQRTFGQAFIDHRDDEPMRTGAEYLGPYLQEQRQSQLKALSSHHVRFPLPELENIKLIPLILLRNPIDRAGSVYSFERQQKAKTPGAIHAKKFPFPEYVDWRMETQVPGVLRNAQVRATCPTQKRNIINESDYAAALERIKNYFLFGLVERYDESMVLIEDQLRPHFPEIDLAHIAQNTSSRHQKSISKKTDDIKLSLGDERFDKLLENNQWDLKLYKEAEKLLSKQIVKTSGFPEKLAHYKTRCQAL